MRQIKFKKPWGRTYGYQALPVPAGPPDPDVGGWTKADILAHSRGNDYPQHGPGSQRIIDDIAKNGLRQWASYPSNDNDLNMGPAPAPIRRRTMAIDRGAVANGSNTIRRGFGAFGTVGGGSLLLIPHQRIPRVPIGGRVFLRTVDYSSTIPARGIGAPVKS